jgi:hypothetical protein
MFGVLIWQHSCTRRGITAALPPSQEFRMTTHPSFRWRRIVPLVAVLVTTGVAAAPIRGKLLSLVGNPLGLWNVTTAPIAHVAPSSSVAPRFGAELDAALITAPDRLEHGSAGASGTARIIRETVYVRWTDYLGSRRGGQNSSSGVRRGWGGRWAVGGGNGGSVAGGGGGGQRRRGEETARSASNSTNSNRSSGGGSSSNGSSKPNKKPSGNASATQFAEHRLGLPELSHGLGLGPLQGSLGAAASAAATPEPATFLLLGTGLVAAAGAMRRRMR